MLLFSVKVSAVKGDDPEKDQDSF